MAIGIMLIIPILPAQWNPVNAQEGQPVDLELVLAIDTSTSVDSAEFLLQRQGLYEAFLHRDVVAAINTIGELGIAVTLIQWSGTDNQRTVIDWTRVYDRESAARFSNRIRAMPREILGLTDIAGVIRYALTSLDNNIYAGFRRVIDISGDGSSDAASSALERDRAVLRNVTVNGLVIYNEDYDLGELAKDDVRDHYLNHVIGGNGAFMMIAADFEDFATAIRNKLIREITGPLSAELNLR